MIGDLPSALDFGGKSWAIRTDYRDVLNVLVAFGDPELDDREKVYVCLVALYKDFNDIPSELYEDAYKAALVFIDCKRPWEDEAPQNVPSPRSMDWEQDETLIFSAINRVAGCEVRALEYLHWWTFMGYYMEMPPEGVFGQVLQLRKKKAKGQKFDKHEQEFWNHNRDICILRKKLTAAQREAEKKLNAMLNGG